VGGKTPRPTVQKARNLLRSVDANILGALVNNVKIDLSGMYYPLMYSSSHSTTLTRTAGLR